MANPTATAELSRHLPRSVDRADWYLISGILQTTGLLERVYLFGDERDRFTNLIIIDSQDARTHLRAVQE